MEDYTTIRSHLLGLEEKLLLPEVRKSPEILSELISDDFIELGSSGKIFTKNEVIEFLSNEVPDRIVLDDFKIKELSQGLIQATYNTMRYKETGEIIYCVRSSIWKLFEGQWKIIFHQGTINRAVSLNSDWTKEFNAAITVCDNEGKIIYMNDKSALTFEADGGFNLIGKNLFECHSPASIEKIKEIMREKRPNTYTIEKKGIKKLIYQSPWYKNGEMKGLVEISIEIPFEMNHFIR